MMSMLTMLTLAQAADGPTPPTFWMPTGASAHASNVDSMMWWINLIMWAFLVLNTVLTVYFVWKYRHKVGTKFRTDGPDHNGPLELAWTVGPLLICIVLFIFGFKGYLDVRTPPKESYDINVTAYKWGWQFKYPNGAQSDDLVIPAGKPVRLVMRASDVLHSCYIPAFRVKQDLVPGRYTYLWFQSDFPTGMDQPTDGHHLFCTEYCGTGHSNMNRRVYVLPQEQFDAWTTKQANWLDEIPEEELYWKAGPKLYARCVQCHSLDGTKGIGPSWKGIWARVSGGEGSNGAFAGGSTYSGLIGAGKQYATAEDYIRASIYNPGEHLVQGYGNVMPTFKGQINDKGIDALIGMMKKLDEFDPKTGAWLKTPPAAAPTASAK